MMSAVQTGREGGGGGGEICAVFDDVLFIVRSERPQT